MEQEIQDISIQRIQEAIPQLLGIDNELIIDYTEYTMPNDKHPIHRYPIRFDGLYIPNHFESVYPLSEKSHMATAPCGAFF